MTSLGARIARYRHRRLLKRMAGPRLMQAFAESYPAARFVEIGANDGQKYDHVHSYASSGAWTGLMVEPVTHIWERLARHYEAVPGVTAVNAAVSDRDGRMTFFYLRDVDPVEAARLPDFYDALGSFSREAILNHAPQIPDIEERIVEREVEVLRFDTLLARHGLDAVDLVVIDTEGHDWAIVRSIDLLRQGPRLLVYEHFHLSPAERAEARAHLGAAGYDTIEEGFDTFCLRRPTGAPDELDRFWGRLRPAVPGVTKDAEAA